MSTAIKEFNSLNGPVSEKVLDKLMQVAEQEGQTALMQRIAGALAVARRTKEQIELVVSKPALEQLPRDLEKSLEELPNYVDESEYTGLNKAVSQDDIYQMITNKMIKLIESASGSGYQKKWKAKAANEGYLFPYNFVSKKAYRGINIGLLTEFMTEALENPFFLTFKQIEQNGGKLQKGSKGFPVVYFTKLYTIDQREPKLDFATYDIKKFIAFCKKNKAKINNINRYSSLEEFAKFSYLPILKYYNVFNGSDIDGIDFDLKNFKKGYVSNEELKLNNDPRVELADLIVKNYPQPQPPLRHKGSRAFYSVGGDYVQMPKYEVFETGLDYYRTLLHEFIHSTGSAPRLARDFSGKFGSPNYAREELVAEFGAVFLSAHAGIIWRTQKNHAEYLKNWTGALKHLKKDNRLLMRAASKAQAATDFVLNLDPEGVPKYIKDLEKEKLQEDKGAFAKAKKEKKELPKKVTTKKQKKKAQDPTPKKVVTRGYTKKEVVKSIEAKNIKTKVDVWSFNKGGTDKLYYGAITDIGKEINTSMFATKGEAIGNAQRFVDFLDKEEFERLATIIKDTGSKIRRAATRKKRGTSAKVNDKGQYALLGNESKDETQQGDTTTLPGGGSRPGVSTSQKSKGRYSASDIMDMEFTQIDLPDEWLNLFPDAPEKIHLAFMGQPKNGKSVSACQWGAEVGKDKKILYNFADQGIIASTQKILQITGLGKCPGLTVTAGSTLDELEKDIIDLKPDYVFIDMINDYIDNEKITPAQFKRRFIEAYPDVSFNLVFEATKNGDFKGDQKWTHLVDQLITIKDYIMYSKGRYGSGERIIWEEGAKKHNPTKYAEIKEQLSPDTPAETPVLSGTQEMAYSFEVE